MRELSSLIYDIPNNAVKVYYIEDRGLIMSEKTEENMVENYYGNVYDKSLEIVENNKKALEKLHEKKIQKGVRDQKAFLYILSFLKNSNIKNRDNSDYVLSFTEDLLFDGDVDLSDEEMQFLLCFMDVYSTTSSSSSTMDTNLSTLIRRSKLFTRIKGDKRVNTVNNIINVMSIILVKVKDTLSPIKNFAKKIVDNFEDRFKYFKSSIINKFYDRVYSLEETIISNKVLNKNLGMIDPEYFDEKFNFIFSEYLQKLTVNS